MGLIKTDEIAPNGSTGLLLYTDIQATVVGLKLESGGGVGFGSAGVPSGIKVDVLGNIATATLSIPTSSTIAAINTISTMRIGQTNSSIKLNIGCNGSSSWIQSYNTSNIAGAPLLLQSGGGNVGIGTASPTVALDVSGAVNATSLNVSGAVNATSLNATSSNVSGVVNANSFVGIGTIPIGGIIMWNGTTIPTGWAFCNGQVVGTIITPDLTNKFIISRSASNVTTTSIQGSATTTGGSKDAVVVAHTHTWNNWSNSDSGSGYFAVGSQGNEGSMPLMNPAGESGVNKNLPPYYALAFIMRIV